MSPRFPSQPISLKGSKTQIISMTALMDRDARTPPKTYISRIKRLFRGTPAEYILPKTNPRTGQTSIIPLASGMIGVGLDFLGVSSSDDDDDDEGGLAAEATTGRRRGPTSSSSAVLP